MPKIIKKIYHHLSQKRVILPLILCGVLFLLVPTHFTHAVWGLNWIGKGLEVITSLPALLLAFILSICTWVAAGLLGLSTLLLDWAINNPFPVSMTVPGAYPLNPIIQIGWTLTRDLVNMFFILGLSYIGLATALNLNNFETKKAFKNLILVALLINFTPVICGVIVDAANIISNFFLRGVSFAELMKIFTSNQKQVLAEFKNPLQMGDKIPAILQSLMLIVFGLVTFFLFILYSILFIVRAPIIWILVILSPLAFFAWIFDQTKKYFDQWWDIFIQWTMIVVPAGFFLYLGMHVLVKSKGLMKELPGDGGIDELEGMAKIFTSLGPIFIVILFLGIGLMMSLKINAAGSGAIVGASKKWGGKGLKAGGDLAKMSGKGIGKGIRNKYRGRKNAPPSTSDTEAYNKWAGEHKVSAALRKGSRYAFGGGTEEETRKWGKGGQKWARRVVRGAGAVATVGGTYTAKRAIRKGGAMVDEDTNKEITDKTSKLEGKSLATVQAALDNAVTNTGRLAAIKAARKNNQTDHLNLPDKLKEKVIKTTYKTSPGQTFEAKNLDPYITARVVEEAKMPEKIQKEAGMFIKYEDMKKYGKVITAKNTEGEEKNVMETIVDGDDKLKAMTAEEKDVALMKDQQGKAIPDTNGNNQYRINTYDELESKYDDDTDIRSAKIIAGIKAAQMNSLDEKTALKIADTQVLHEFWEGAQVSKAAELFGTAFISKFQGKANKLTSDFYEKNNKPLFNFLKSTGAQRIGLTLDGTAGANIAEGIDKLVQEHSALNERKETVKNDNSMTAKMKGIAVKNLDRMMKEKETKIKELNKAEKQRRVSSVATQASGTQSQSSTTGAKPKKDTGKQEHKDLNSV